MTVLKNDFVFLINTWYKLIYFYERINGSLTPENFNMKHS